MKNLAPINDEQDKVTKKYVDDAVDVKFDKAGGTIAGDVGVTGQVDVNGDIYSNGEKVATLDENGRLPSFIPTQTANNGTISNNTFPGLKIQSGWGQFLGNSTTSIQTTVTFPESFTTVMGVIISFNGYKATAGAAADIRGFNTRIATSAWIEAVNITDSNFIASASNTNTMGARYHGYSWVAWGV